MSKNKTPSHIERMSSRDIEDILSDENVKIHGERYTQYRNQYHKIVDGEDLSTTPDQPITLGIELVNKCNFLCKMCLTPSLKHEPKIVITEKNKNNMLREISKLKIPAVMFGMGEEPLLYKKFTELAKEIKQAGVMDIFLFTNGLLLNEKISQELVDIPITRIYVSLDAATEKTFHKVRGRDQLLKIENNVKNLIKYRNKKNKNLPIVRVSFCITEDNKSEKNMFVSKWKEIVDHIDFQTVHDFSKVNEMSLLSSRELQDETTKHEGLMCSQSWEKLTVWANGDVSPCCTFHGKNLIIGNINYQSIQELWNGSNINKIREQLRSGNINKVCHECITKRGI